MNSRAVSWSKDNVEALGERWYSPRPKDESEWAIILRQARPLHGMYCLRVRGYTGIKMANSSNMNTISYCACLSRLRRDEQGHVVLGHQFLIPVFVDSLCLVFWQQRWWHGVVSHWNISGNNFSNNIIIIGNNFNNNIIIIIVIITLDKGINL
jgi:hypothetical protein